jgi:hypothetical protein
MNQMRSAMDELLVALSCRLERLRATTAKADVNDRMPQGIVPKPA